MRSLSGPGLTGPRPAGVARGIRYTVDWAGAAAEATIYDHGAGLVEVVYYDPADGQTPVAEVAFEAPPRTMPEDEIYDAARPREEVE